MSDLGAWLDAPDDGPTIPPVPIADRPRNDDGTFAPIAHDMFDRPIVWKD